MAGLGGLGGGGGVSGLEGVDLKLECEECSMSFATREELANHKTKFCVDSVYYDTEALERQLKRESAEAAAAAAATSGPAAAGTAMKFDDVRSYLAQRAKGGADPSVAALSSLATLKESFESDERQRDRLARELVARRERQLADDATKLKVQQQQIRARRTQESSEIKELMAEMEKHKTEELQARMEREAIKRSLVGVDGSGLQALEQTKQKELAALSREREALADKEDALLSEIEALEKSIVDQESAQKRQAEESEAALRALTGGNKDKDARLQRTLQLAEDRGRATAALRAERARLQRERSDVQTRIRETRAKANTLAALRPGGGGKPDKSKDGALAFRPPSVEDGTEESLNKMVAQVTSSIDKREERLAHLRAQMQADSLRAAKDLADADEAWAEAGRGGVRKADGREFVDRASTMITATSINAPRRAAKGKAPLLRPTLEELDRLVEENGGVPDVADEAAEKAPATNAAWDKDRRRGSRAGSAGVHAHARSAPSTPHGGTKHRRLGSAGGGDAESVGALDDDSRDAYSGRRVTFGPDSSASPERRSSVRGAGARVVGGDGSPASASGGSRGSRTPSSRHPPPIPLDTSTPRGEEVAFGSARSGGSSGQSSAGRSRRGGSSGGSPEAKQTSKESAAAGSHSSAAPPAPGPGAAGATPSAADGTGVGSVPGMTPWGWNPMAAAATGGVAGAAAGGMAGAHAAGLPPGLTPEQAAAMGFPPGGMGPYGMAGMGYPYGMGGPMGGGMGGGPMGGMGGGAMGAMGMMGMGGGMAMNPMQGMQLQLLQQQQQMLEMENQRLQQDLEAIHVQQQNDAMAAQQAELSAAMQAVNARIGGYGGGPDGAAGYGGFGGGGGAAGGPAGFPGMAGGTPLGAAGGDGSGGALAAARDEAGDIGALAANHGLDQEEAAALALLRALPKDSAAYKIQLDHVKELTRIRCEIDRLTQTAKLERIRAEADREKKELKAKTDHEQWLAEQKRQLKEARIRKAMAKEIGAAGADAAPSGAAMQGMGALMPSPGKLRRPEYDPEDGFAIDFDFAVMLPARASQVVIAYCLYDGTKPKVPVVQMAPVETSEDPNSPEDEVQPLRRCLVHAQRVIKNVEASKQLRLVVELKRVVDSPGAAAGAGAGAVAGAGGDASTVRTRSLGYSALDLFWPASTRREDEDPEVELHTGMFKLPLFKPPVDPSKLELKTLQGQATDSGDAAICIRVHLAPDAPPENDPAAPAFTAQPSYRSILDLARPTTAKAPPKAPTPAPAAPSPAGRTETPADTTTLTSLDTPSPAPPSEPTAADEDVSVLSGVGSLLSFNVKPRELEVPIASLGPLALRVSVWRAGAIATAEEGPMKGKKLVFATAAQMRADLADAFEFSEVFEVKGLKPARDAAVVYEILNAATEDGKPPPRPSGAPGAKLPAYAEGPALLWGVVKLVDVAKPKELKAGTHAVRMMTPPASTSLSQEEQEDKVADGFVVLTDIEAAAADGDEDNEDDAKASEGKEASPAGKPKTITGLGGSDSEDESEKKTAVSTSTVNSAIAFLAVENPPPISKLFKENDGFDVYIDGCRFLPDNVTISKVNAKLMSSGFTRIGEVIECVARLDSTTQSPMFAKRYEFREDSFDPTATLVCRIDAVESHTHQIRCAGYALLNAFVLPGPDAEQPNDSNTQEFLLNEGAFQLPLFQAPPAKGPDGLSESSLDDMEVVPCATLLVRVVRAPKSRDGLKTLSIKETPQSEWASKGLVVPMPHYGSKAYDSTRAAPSEAETAMYPRRKAHACPTIRATLEHFAEADVAGTFGAVPPPSASDDELYEWMESRLKAAPAGMLDFAYLSEYHQESGFRVAMDGIYNSPKTGSVVKALFCLSPPAPFYASPKMTEEVEFTRRHNWDSPIKHQQFTDDFHNFRDVPLQNNLVVIVDVRELKIKGSTVTPLPLGWTVLPVFDQGYVRRGSFLLPLIQGEVSSEALREIEFGRSGAGAAGAGAGAAGGRDPFEYLHAEAAKGRRSTIKWVPNCSVLVRLNDGQLNGVVDVSVSEYDDVYVPKDLRKKYALDRDKIAKDTKLLRKLVPKRQDAIVFQKELNVKFAAATEVTHYNF